MITNDANAFEIMLYQNSETQKLQHFARSVHSEKISNQSCSTISDCRYGDFAESKIEYFFNFDTTTKTSRESNQYRPYAELRKKLTKKRRSWSYFKLSEGHNAVEIPMNKRWFSSAQENEASRQASTESLVKYRVSNHANPGCNIGKIM